MTVPCLLQVDRKGQYRFPAPAKVDPDGYGLVAFGGDLDPSTLLSAYRQGIFPWFNADEPIAWWCPEPRCIIDPNQFKPSRSLKAAARTQPYQLTLNRDFAGVIAACAAPRDYADGTWISEEIQDSYHALHQSGFAFSIEVWADEPAQSELIGGLYGLQLGQAFFGESMFSRRTETSKMAFWLLMKLCAASGFDWVDCQLPNDHLMQLGATTVPREQFLRQLAAMIDLPRPGWNQLGGLTVPSQALSQPLAGLHLVC